MHSACFAELVFRVAKMRGDAPSLKDITLDMVPDAVDLHCDEVLPESEEEQEEQRSVQLVLEYYEVGCACYCCERKVRFTCAADADSILLLQELLVESGLQFLCARCGVTTSRNGRK